MKVMTPQQVLKGLQPSSRKPKQSSRKRNTARPKLLEKHVAKQIDDYLQLDGWEVIITAAENLTRSGRPSFNPGTSDRLYIRKTPARKLVECFFAELKASHAKTKTDHKQRQAVFQLTKQVQGYLAYRCPDNIPDPFAHFIEWYRSHFQTRF